MQHQKVSGQGIDLSEGEEAGLPSQPPQARRDKRRGRPRARQGRWEGGGGPREEEGGESGRNRRESWRERAETGESGGWDCRKLLGRESEATTRRKLEEDKEEGELGSEGNGDKY